MTEPRRTPRPDRCKECGLLKVYGDAYESRVLEQAHRLCSTRHPVRWVRAMLGIYREWRRLQGFPAWFKPGRCDECGGPPGEPALPCSCPCHAAPRATDS